LSSESLRGFESNLLIQIIFKLQDKLVQKRLWPKFNKLFQVQKTTLLNHRVLTRDIEHEFWCPHPKIEQSNINQCNFSDIVKHIGNAISTISSHITHFKEEGIISTIRNRQAVTYKLTNSELVADGASKYKLNLIDRNINNFIERVEEL
jgi:DNA-binding transcriptional ArsR family regulator